MPDDEPQISDDPDESRYRAELDGALAGVAIYDRDGDLVTFTHTRVAPQFEGRGVGTALIRTALDEVRSRGEHIVAQCSFVAQFIEDNPAYADLVTKTR